MIKRLDNVGGISTKRLHSSQARHYTTSQTNVKTLKSNKELYHWTNGSKHSMNSKIKHYRVSQQESDTNHNTVPSIKIKLVKNSSGSYQYQLSKPAAEYVVDIDKPLQIIDITDDIPPSETTPLQSLVSDSVSKIHSTLVY